MAIIDMHLLVQTILYFCIFICGFAFSIPVGVNKNHFDGCILYSDFEKTDKSHYTMIPSKDANCNFPVYTGVFACIFYGLALGCYNAYAVWRSRKSSTVGSEMWVMPFILFNSVICAVVFIAACMISIGFKQFCGNVIEYGGYKSCADAQNREWTHLGTGEKFNVGNFKRLLTVAQIAVWVCCLLFALEVVLGILRAYRNRRLRKGTASDKENIGRVDPTA